MSHILEINRTEQLTQFTGLSSLDANRFIQHSPDAHWVLVGDHNQILARCSIWWKNTPPYPNHKLGFIGDYEAKNRAASHQLLTHACAELAKQECTLAVAPINGNTWQSYRFITQRGEQPLFFLESDHPDEWVEYFLSDEFTTFTEYSSALNSDLTQEDPRLEKVRDRLSQLDVQIRTINLDDFDAELQQIYQLCLTSFRNNLLYTPISEAEFLSLYRPILPYIKPEFVLIAEHQNKTVGFLFAIPDFLQTKRQETIDTIIIKTVATLPERQYAGLGNVLVADCQRKADRLGYKQAIHALMHDANNSRNLSLRYANSIRKYALFSKSIKA